MRALVAAQVISSLGSLMAAVALPWFVLETTGSASRMALVLAAESAPLAFVGVPSARLARRLGARRTLLLCDAVWAPAAALVPLLHAAGALTFGLLVACALVAGLPWAASAGCLQAIVPELLGEDVASVARANAVLRTVDRLAYFAGPALGGALLPLIAAPAVLALDAASFCASGRGLRGAARRRPGARARRRRRPLGRDRGRADAGRGAVRPRRQSIVRTSLPRTWPSSMRSCASAARSSGYVASTCGRSRPSCTSGVTCSPRS